MKLAEALILRADLLKRVQQLRERLVRSAQTPEGERPPEDPPELLAEGSQLLTQYTDIVSRINRTNSATSFKDGLTVTDALAVRDTLTLERSLIDTLITAAANPAHRYQRAEIKYVSTVSIADLQKRKDELARRYRELDSAIQALNWNVDLL
ncbi:MAG: DIP1984 family protein [Chloroflexi bacterium]|nr:DIP1984 family protein [Chloroflexota bacterium]MCC6891918.1 DIP1984 family protein [Anaerolineae bacterium]